MRRSRSESPAGSLLRLFSILIAKVATMLEKNRFKGDPSKPGFFGSLINKLTGAGLTEAQYNEREYQTEMANTSFQRQVADMKQAGLNPSLLYGSGAGSGAPVPDQTGAGDNGSSLGELMNLMLVGKQAKLLEAQAAKTTQEAGKIDRETAWIDRLNDAQLKENMSRVRLNESTIDLNAYDKAYKAAQTALVDVQSKHQGALMQAQTKGAQAKAALDYAEAAISQMEKSLGHRLSSSELLAVIDSITALLTDKKNVTKPVVDKVVDQITTHVYDTINEADRRLNTNSNIERWKRRHYQPYPGGGGR